MHNLPIHIQENVVKGNNQQDLNSICFLLHLYSILWKMEEDFKIEQMEDNFNILTNGRQPQYLG